MKKIFTLLCALVVLTACNRQSAQPDNLMMVSIEPLKYIVEGIVGDDFEVATIVPAGASPETYEPTPAQMEQLEAAQMVFAVGLIGFEQNTIERMTQSADVQYVNLSEGVVPSVCEHHAECQMVDKECVEAEKFHGEQCAHHAHSHTHGDRNPHLWTSPRMLRQMATTAYQHISRVWPDSVKYQSNYNSLMTRLDSLEVSVSRRLSEAPSRAFVIYHPTFGYLAAEHGLIEIAVETHGKEPSADHLRRVVDAARKLGAQKVFYQREFPRSVVEAVAAELQVEPIEVDILSGDVEAMIYGFADKLAR